MAERPEDAAAKLEQELRRGVIVLPVGDDEEAIRTANDTEYGLSAAVFSRNIYRAYSVAQPIL